MMKTDNKTFGELLDIIADKGHLSIGQRMHAREIVMASKEVVQMPILPRMLLAFGAWLSALFLIGFINLIFLAGLRSPVASLLIIGVLQIVVALVLSPVWKEKDSYASMLFYQQFAFMVMISGKIMVVAGCVIAMGSIGEVVLLIAALVSFILTIITFTYFKLDGERLLSFLSSVALLGIWIAVSGYHMVFGVFTALMVALLWFSFIKRDVPIVWGYSAVLALPVIVIFMSVMEMLPSSMGSGIIDSYLIKFPVTLVISIATVALCLHAARNCNEREGWVLKILAVVSGILGLVSLPGVALAIGLMVFGYEVRNRIITGVGILFLPVFLFMLYYRLDITLLQKSISLVLSGGLLLIARYIINSRGRIQDA